MHHKNLIEFWKKKGLDHIIPKTGNKFPEGFDVYEELKEFIGNHDLIEFGCGYGRLCKAFKPDKYTGVDINPSAISKAQKNNPNHNFLAIQPFSELPKTELLLAYTVLLHISDQDIDNCIKILTNCSKYVVVCEIMDSRWRLKEGTVPVFNRNPEDYIIKFLKHNFYLVDYKKKLYQRYNKLKWKINIDIRMSFLKFERLDL